MRMKEIDELAIMWNKTKDPVYKDKWYKAIKNFSAQVSSEEQSLYRMPILGKAERRRYHPR